jgi:hypothetical protein
LLFVGLRSRLDFYRTGLAGRWRYHGSWLGLLIGAVSLGTASAGFTVAYLGAAAGVVLSAVFLAPEWSGIRKDRVDIHPAPRMSQPPADVPSGQLVRHPSPDHVGLAVAWAEVDGKLPLTQATCSWSGRRARLSPQVSKYTYDILTKKVTGRTVYNGKLVRQDADLTEDLLRNDGNLQFSLTDYFTLLCSNYMVGWRVHERIGGHRILDGPELLRDPSGMLVPLAQSGLANAIGVSTLALTTDRRLVIVRQAFHSQSSSNQLAPSGSGSVDLRDVRPIRPAGRRSLVEILAQAMRRELCEETGLRSVELGVTRVLGYFRWLDMGGKPEYVGITTLHVSSDELHPRRPHIEEAPYVADVSYDGEVDFAQLQHAPEDLSCLDARFPAHEVSMPLFLCLRALGRQLGRKSQVGGWLRRQCGLARTS